MTPELNEMSLLRYIEAKEAQTGMIALSELFRGLAHPARMADMLESLESKKLINFSGRMSTQILQTIKPLAEATRNLEGPKEYVPDERQRQAMAQRGFTARPGETFVDAGMAVIAFNRKAREQNFAMALSTRVHVTPAGMRAIAAAGPGPIIRP